MIEHFSFNITKTWNLCNSCSYLIYYIIIGEDKGSNGVLLFSFPALPMIKASDI